MTDFADGAVVVPVAAAVLAVLLGARERRGALLWLATVGGVMAAVLALKLSFAGCVPPSPLAAWHSPSGHTATAAVVYGGLAAVLGGGRVATAAQALAVAGLIGASRVMLGMHSPAEAVAGGLVGLCGAILLALGWPPANRRRRRALAVLIPLAVLVVAGALHGTHWSAEPLIRRTSWRFWPLRACAG